MPAEENTTPQDSDKYFRTDHLIENIGGRAARGGAVAISSQAIRFVLTMLATSVMARLLTPQDYGLIGMVAIVTSFVSMYKDLGLSAATIQRTEINAAQISTLFWVNVVLSVVIALITAGAAPLVSWFYGEPRLVGITVVTSIGLVVGGLAVQHEALLRRQMRFVALAGISITSMVVGYTVAIFMAARGFNYWALVGGQLAQIATTTTATFVMCRWRPGLPKGGSGAFSMLKFGGNFTGFSTLNFFARNIDNLLIGRVWGAQQLGVYSRAYQLMMLPIDQINEPVSSVAIPSLSRLTGNSDNYRAAYLRMLEKVALLTMPAVGLMIATSDWIVEIVLGPKWHDVGVLLVILGVAGMMQPISNSTGWLFITQGRTKELFRFAMFICPVTMASIVAGLPWGAFGVAVSYVIGQLITINILYWYVGRRGPIRTADFYRTIAPFFVASVLAMGACMGFRYWQKPASNVLGLAICAVITMVTTLFVLALIPAGKRALIDTVRSIKLVAVKRTSDSSSLPVPINTTTK